jgi:hypothetical protein
MKPKAFLFALVLCFFTAAGCFAQGMHMGTWKLNEAKSKIAAGAAKNHTVVYEAAGDQIKVTVDGTAGDGTATHNEWTGKFDGKYYPVTGEANADERSYRRIGARTLTFTQRKAGKVTLTGRITITRNGKTRTVTTNGTDANGKRSSSTGVYDKQSM